MSADLVHDATVPEGTGIVLDLRRIRKAARLPYLGTTPAGHGAELLEILAAALDHALFDIDARDLANRLRTLAGMIRELERRVNDDY